MSIYDIKPRVPVEDYHKIIEFLSSCWNPNHALVKSKDLLDFQHFNRMTNSYNFIVAENKITGKIDALSGYIPTSQYDPKLFDQGDYWGAIWKRRDNICDVEGKQLGLETFEQVYYLPNFKTLGGISLSGDAIKWYKALRWQMDYMHQYYIMNADYSKFSIADNVSERNLTDASPTKDGGWFLKWIDIDKIRSEEIIPEYRPLKTLNYLVNRYKHHPIYLYRYLGLFNNNHLKAILITRTIDIKGNKILRIVDVFGKLCGYVYSAMQDVLREGNYEYVDCLNYGISPEVFKKMGFSENYFTDEGIVLPNYFEPFEKRNVKMTVVYKAKFDYIFFKGDADQDRPNII